jgi:uncharacterized membrane protein
MPETNEQIELLQTRLDKMVEYQDYFFREINLIRTEIDKLKTNQPVQKVDLHADSPKKSSIDKNVSLYIPPQKSQSYQPADSTEETKEKTTSTEPKSRERQTDYSTSHDASPGFQSARATAGLEEFIGKNIISLIGIIITVIGVAIGAKYAIDRDLISPAARIVLGYVFAFGVFGTAARLKSKYLNFSAVLLSGAMAMMYFLTFFAYSYYNLIPQPAAFLMMLCITAFTVAAAINYNRQVIAHIGLVGAYAVPFLLSNNSGRFDILFGYMTIINFGILIVSVKKFWKPLYYSSFIVSWLIFSAWYFAGYKSTEHFTIAFAFLIVFFLTFYLTFVTYKLIAEEEFNAEIVWLTLANSSIFYGLGYSMIEGKAGGQQFLGLFTLLNAGFHFFIAAVIHKYKLGGKINLYLPVGLALTFMAIVVPVQFSGHWITLFWTAEALFLFVLGRKKHLAILETFSYPLMLLATLSLLNDWQTAFSSQSVITPLLNSNFLTSILFAAAFGVIWFVNKDESETSVVSADLQRTLNYAIPAIFLIVLYNSFRVEIGNYFNNQLITTAIQKSPLTVFDSPSELRDSSLSSFNIVWQINYTMLFLTLLSFVNIKRIKSEVLGFINLGLNILAITIFLSVGLYAISELRENYLGQTGDEIFTRGIFHLAIRYISFAFAAGLIAAIYKYIKQNFLKDAAPDFDFDTAFDLVFYSTILWLASSELLNWMDIYNVQNSYKLGLSILWGTYALLLIILGIYKKKKHLRIGAIVLFAATLVKLFFYDIASLDTISKTIVFVSLGILLLIISFLYNKFKDVIFADEEK